MTDPRAPQTADDLLMGGGSGGRAVSFGPLGSAPGRIIRLRLTEPGRLAEQRDIDGNIETWERSGEVKMQPVYTGTCEVSDDNGATWHLVVDPTDDNDTGDGTRSLFVKMSNQPGGMSRAIREAVVAAGAAKPQPGGVLTVQWYGEVATGNRGGKARQYRAWYTAPADDVLMAEPAAVAPPVAPAVAPPAAPSAPPAAPQAAAVAPAAPAPAAGPSDLDKARELLKLGADPAAVATALGLDPAVVALLPRA